MDIEQGLRKESPMSQFPNLVGTYQILNWFDRFGGDEVSRGKFLKRLKANLHFNGDPKEALKEFYEATLLLTDILAKKGRVKSFGDRGKLTQQDKDLLYMHTLVRSGDHKTFQVSIADYKENKFSAISVIVLDQEFADATIGVEVGKACTSYPVSSLLAEDSTPQVRESIRYVLKALLANTTGIPPTIPKSLGQSQ